MGRVYSSQDLVKGWDSRFKGIYGKLGEYNDKYFDVLASALVKFFSPKKHLDIGCGKGAYLVREMKILGVESYGLDFSEVALMGTKDTIRGSCEELPFADKTFDLITLFQLLPHTLNPESCLVECKRVMRKGGYIVITNTDYEKINSTHPWLDVHKLKNEEWKGMLVQLGFKLISVKKFEEDIRQVPWYSNDLIYIARRN